MMLDPISEKNIAGVHPDLQRLTRQAFILTKQPFLVIEGLRSATRQAALYAKGLTMNQKNGMHELGMAIDFACLTNGKIDWTVKLYSGVWQAFQAASKATGIPCEWSGNWVHFKEFDHIQLPRGYKPKA